MKHFLIRFGIFLFLLFLAFCLVDFLKLSHRILPNRDVYTVIERSKATRDKTKVLILGDSIARQLFDPLDQSGENGVTNLASNQSIDIIGNYFLLHNFLERNHSVERVYLIVNCTSFQNNLDHLFTYNYFLKPFYNSEYKPLFTPAAMEQIKSIPFHRFVSFPPIHATFFTPELNKHKSKSKFLSKISIEYLEAMETVLEERGIQFKVISPPVSQAGFEDAQIYKSVYESTRRLPHHFDQYFESMIFLPASWYPDGAHFTNEKIKEARRILIDQLDDEILSAAIAE